MDRSQPVDELQALTLLGVVAELDLIKAFIEGVLVTSASVTVSP